MTAETAVLDLAAQIRAELSDRAPEGFAFNDHLLRQDASLERMVAKLKEHGDQREVAAAISEAVQSEHRDWTLLKLLELADRLLLPDVAQALIALAENTSAETERGQFLAGRACEVLLRLPLDVPTRARANQVCRLPLQRVARFRLGTDRERMLQRPRRVEWTLLVVLMVLALAGFAFAFLALR